MIRGRVTSASGFLDYFALRIRMAASGNSLRDKLGLFIWSIIDSFPMTIRRQHPVLHRKLWRFSSMLISNTVACVRGIRYTLVDSASVIAVSPIHQPWMSDYLTPNAGDVVIDVGAATGTFTLSSANTVGKDGLVIAIEPTTQNYRALLRGIQLNGFGNVVALNIAAWNTNCKMKIFLSHRSGWHSVKRNSGLGYIEVEAKALDEVVKELRVDRVDWIKIDVEGAEIEVLKGLRNTLARWHPKIVVEVTSENRKAFLDLMSRLTYTVTYIRGSRSDFYCQ